MRLLALICLCAPLTLCAPIGAEPPPVRWSARLEPAGARPGEGARIVVTARIARPWHLYSTTQPAGGAQAMSIALLPNASLKARGKIAQPPWRKRSNPAFHITDQLYEGVVSFGVPVVLDKASGTVRGVVQASFNVCTDTLCAARETVRIPFSWTPRPGSARAGRKSTLVGVPAQLKKSKSARPSRNNRR